MSLLKQIDDKGAVLEWSPYAERASMVALATKDSAGAGFDEYGGDTSGSFPPLFSCLGFLECSIFWVHRTDPNGWNYSVYAERIYH